MENIKRAISAEIQQDNKMEIECVFKHFNTYLHGSHYTCLIEHKVIPEGTELIFNGVHQGSKSNDDVIAIKFDSCDVTKVPQGLTKTFPKLEILCITGSNLETLTRNDLVEYQKFSCFEFSGNPIEFLPRDLFEGFDKIQTIAFTGCDLKLIEPNTFDGLCKYELEICLTGNINYDYFFKPLKGEYLIDTFQNFRQYIYQKYYSRIKFNRQQEKDDEALIHEIENMTQRIDKHKIQNSSNINQLKQGILNLEKSLENFKTKLQNFRPRKVQKIQNTESTSVMSMQHSDINFSVDLRNLTKDETFKDFKIIIDDQEFPVHKFLLAARSPTLAEMLRNNPEAENLKLVDISVEIFELILKFLYTDELPNEDGTNFMHLFIAAGRLGIKELNNFAGVKLFESVSAKNALEVLNLSNKYGQDELRQKAFEEIKKNYSKIEFKDEWSEDGEKMTKIIKAFEIKEEMMRKADEEFKNLLK